MKFTGFKTDNLKFYYYDIGSRKEFKFIYKIPTIDEFKSWWSKLWKRKSNS